MQQLLEPIRLARFRFHLEAITPLQLPPYKGSTFRGAFGITLKDVVCVQRQLDRCQPCLLRMTCVYPYLFETPNFKPDASLLPPDGQAPQPFVLEPPLEETTRYEPGELLSFDIVLIGKALDYLPYVIFVFSEIGRKGVGKGRGRYRVRAVMVGGGRVEEWENGRMGEELIYDGATQMIHDPPIGYDRIHLDVDTIPGDKLALRFLTPTRMKEQGQFLRQPTFAQLIKHLLIRVSLLATYHCDITLDLDFKSLIAESQSIRTSESRMHWHDWERYSNRQQQKLPMHGMVGTISFAGNLAVFLPLLRMGEYIHLGAGTAFGLGRYRLHSTPVMPPSPRC